MICAAGAFFVLASFAATALFSTEARAQAEAVELSKQILTNSLGMRLIRIEPGEFMMGSPADERGRYANETQHKVILTRPYMIGMHEVTRGQFAQFVRATGFRTDAEKEGWAFGHHALESEQWGSTWRSPGFEQTDEHPVVCVTWNDAVTFCDWLSRTEGRRYRLPTEAEWAYACRAGSDTMYPWGEDPSEGDGWTNALDNTAQAEIPGLGSGYNFADGFVYTSPVGSFKANPWNLYDMIGNVCEWCHDCYGDFPAETVTDPTGPANGLARVLRGGSWDLQPQLTRSANRAWSSPRGRFSFAGFRVVLEVR